MTRADAINRSMGTSGSTEGAGGAGGSSGSTRVTGGKPRSTDADLSRMSADDQETYQKIKDTTPKGGIPDWMKQVDKKPIPELVLPVFAMYLRLANQFFPVEWG